MTYFYNQLADKRCQTFGPGKWSGNQRWLALEGNDPLNYIFQTTPLSEEDGDMADEGGGMFVGKRTLFQLRHASPEPILDCTYLPDGLIAQTETFRFEQFSPWAHMALF